MDNNKETFLMANLIHESDSQNLFRYSDQYMIEWNNMEQQSLLLEYITWLSSDNYDGVWVDLRNYETRFRRNHPLSAEDCTGTWKIRFKGKGTTPLRGDHNRSYDPPLGSAYGETISECIWNGILDFLKRRQKYQELCKTIPK